MAGYNSGFLNRITVAFGPGKILCAKWNLFPARTTQGSQGINNKLSQDSTCTKAIYETVPIPVERHLTSLLLFSQIRSVELTDKTSS